MAKSCVCYSLISICTVIYQLLAMVFINGALGETLWPVFELVSKYMEPFGIAGLNEDLPL